MTQLYEWRGNECESEVQATVQHASPLRRRTCIRPALAPHRSTYSPTRYHYQRPINEPCYIHINHIQVYSFIDAKQINFSIYTLTVSARAAHRLLYHQQNIESRVNEVEMRSLRSTFD